MQRLTAAVGAHDDQIMFQFVRVRDNAVGNIVRFRSGHVAVNRDVGQKGLP